jgi:galactokinase
VSLSEHPARGLLDQFRLRYGQHPRLFYAPGRINLIGDHTDYNEGFVLPFAIDLGVSVAAAARTDRRLLLYSVQLDEDADIDLDLPEQRRQGTWTDYVEGVARCLESRGARLGGANLLVSGNVPLGAGLSSSAALEIALALALCRLSNIQLDPLTIVLAAQEAEHEYVGTHSGIMDQYVATFGKSHSCLLLDCRSLQSTMVPLRVADTALIVCDTGVKHQLASSEYNLRRAQCAEGVREIRQHLPLIHSLRDVSVSDFQRIEEYLSEPIRQRCRHVVTENARTVEAASALAACDLQQLGRLMFDSHRSLQIDYEVSCPELDILVETSAKTNGVWGSRMTGGGFGGCTINLVRTNAVAEFVEAVTRSYNDTIGSPVRVFETHSADGAHEILLRPGASH